MEKNKEVKVTIYYGMTDLTMFMCRLSRKLPNAKLIADVCIMSRLIKLAGVCVTGGVIMVVQPEDGMHVTYQRKLVSRMKELCPDGSHIIIATHAPEIVGTNTEYMRSIPKCLAESKELWWLKHFFGDSL